MQASVALRAAVGCNYYFHLLKIPSGFCSWDIILIYYGKNKNFRCPLCKAVSQHMVLDKVAWERRTYIPVWQWQAKGDVI